MVLLIDYLDMRCESADVGAIDLHWICVTNAYLAFETVAR